MNGADGQLGYMGVRMYVMCVCVRMYVMCVCMYVCMYAWTSGWVDVRTGGNKYGCNLRRMDEWNGCTDCWKEEETKLKSHVAKVT
jgi:hypothetical protein